MAAILLGPVALAADHRDGSAVITDPANDITDVYSWMPDANHLAMVMNVSPFADTNSKFSNTSQYVFHTNSYGAFPAAAGPEVNLICTFDASATQKISCWLGSEYLSGDASALSGLSTADGKLQVFAGLRSDPFFNYLSGFNNMRASILSAISSSAFTFDAANCPAVSPAQSTAIIGTLAASSQSLDDFASANVLSIVARVDKSLVTTSTAPIVGVWASTNR